MSQQYNKVEKRKRRLRNLKRRKGQHKRAKTPGRAPSPLPASN